MPIVFRVERGWDTLAHQLLAIVAAMLIRLLVRFVRR